MDRRAFLGLFGAGVAGFALDPERALWVPGQKSYHFISRPFYGVQPGMFVYRNPAQGLTRWGVAQSPDILRVGGEMGVYDGLRVITEGPITALAAAHGRSIIFTASSLWSIFPANETASVTLRA